MCFIKEKKTERISHVTLGCFASFLIVNSSLKKNTDNHIEQEKT